MLAGLGWISSLQLFRKTKETESTIAGLQERPNRYDIAYQTFLRQLSDLKSVLVEDTTTSWCEKRLKLA